MRKRFLYNRRERARLRTEYPKGALCPGGYVEFFRWAEAQASHGLKQKRCHLCKRLNFPQERNVLGSCLTECGVLK